MQHVVVYRDERYFCGWPFNGGFWQYADGELAVGFIRGAADYGNPGAMSHRVVDNLYGEQLIVRSQDGGESWDAEHPTSVYRRPFFDAQVKSAPASLGPEAVLDPHADGFTLLSGFGIPPQDAPDTLFVMTSGDRGQTWNPPIRMPRQDFSVLGGRPSYVVRHDGMILLFGHGSRDGQKGTSIPLVFGSTNGGASWGLIGEIDPVPRRPGAIMPYPLMLSEREILIAVRRQYPSGWDAYTQIYRSEDAGYSWRFLSRVNAWGAPASLTLLPDGRIVCVYGYRRPPQGIRARVSSDRGATWGEEIVLRDDGGSGDLGYPRTHLRGDGALVTAYYFNLANDPIQQNGGVRHIAATIWRV
jgi:hypothetical protein